MVRNRLRSVQCIRRHMTYRPKSNWGHGHNQPSHEINHSLVIPSHYVLYHIAYLLTPTYIPVHTFCPNMPQNSASCITHYLSIVHSYLTVLHCPPIVRPSAAVSTKPTPQQRCIGWSEESSPSNYATEKILCAGCLCLLLCLRYVHVHFQ